MTIMLDENKCESPLGGWFGECEITDKNGNIKIGIGKIVANVTYYNKSQGRDNEFTYGMCKDCVRYYRLLSTMADDEDEDNVVIRIEHKDGKIENYNQDVILLD